MTAKANPRTIIVASDRDFHELVAGSLMSMFARQLLPWNTVRYSWQYLKRSLGFVLRSYMSNKPPDENFPQTKEEIFLEQVRLLTGVDFSIARFSPEEAEQKFDFEGGIPPTSGHVYFQHPFHPNRYMIPSSANLTLAKEKVIAFHDIAAHLGAKEITLLSGQVTSKSWRGRLAADLPDAAAQVGINADFGAGSQLSQQLYSRFSKPAHAPSVPKHLELWVKSDPRLASMETNRLENRVLRHKATLQLTEEAQYNAKVVAIYNNIGLNVGGGYKSLIDSVWHFDIEFWP